jgi:hypothetical protein
LAYVQVRYLKQGQCRGAIMLTFFGRGPTETSFALQRDMQLVRGYWEALRQGEALPQRSQINPNGFSGVLDRVFLLERVAKGYGRFRLSGMHLHDLLGMEAAGMPLGALFEPLARERLSEALETVFDGTVILEIRLEAERAIGRPALAGQMLLLPLAHETGGQKLVLGCLMTEGTIGRQPRRFAIASMGREAVHQPRLALVPGSDAPRAAARPQRRPALRLVSSRD